MDRPQSERYLLFLCILWSGAWLVLQLWLQYQGHVDALSSTSRRQPWWNDAGDLQSALGPAAQLVCVLLLVHAIFAWINWDAFRTLLAPVTKPRSTRLAALTAQLFIVTLTAHLANAWLYPHSTTGNALVLTLVQPSGQIILWLLSALVILYCATWIVLRIKRSHAGRYFAAAAVTGLLIAASSRTHTLHDQHLPTQHNRRPDVIIIGVDSLRPDHLMRFGAPFDVTPNINEALDQSVIFADTLTTQAHTFPATVSILTGQHPKTHQARGNLFPASIIRADSSIAHRFRAAGYRTVRAMDETRFANVDDRFGFEELIGPDIGTADFIMSFAADNAIFNLISNTHLGSYLTPNLFGNRAVAYAYRAESFSRQLDRSVRAADARPMFLYAHLCAAHWPYQPESPYRTDDFQSLPTGDYSDTNSRYLRALGEADMQIGRLLASLRESGRLDNAIVVLLSDHGEDFGMRKDAIIDSTGAQPTHLVNGHGGSAFRAPQVQVLLAFRRFGAQEFKPATVTAPTSIIDIAPTLVEFAGLPPSPSAFDGVSLAPFLNGASSHAATARTRFVESSFFPRVLNRTDIDVGEVFSAVSDMYLFTGEGRVEVKRELIPLHINIRQRAAYRGPWLVATLESPLTQPIVINRDTLRWWNLSSAPQSAPAIELLAELCGHWRGDPAIQPHCKIPSAPDGHGSSSPATGSRLPNRGAPH